MTPSELSQFEYKLGKRGFRLVNTLPLQCSKCNERAIAQYVIAGRIGGREIDLCQACGHAQSWRRSSTLEDRELDPTFDLKTFLG
ncbi:MAG TPA: hypothetical protein PLF40_03965 [Kofleriaceae bacterium]|nr:hypothetical protein [Kofleriaceae bacterium]